MTVPMFMMPHHRRRGRGSADWPFAVKSILGFWFFYALTVVVRAFLGTDPWTMLENKLIVIGDRHRHHRPHLSRDQRRSATGDSIRRKAIIAGVSSAIASLVMGGDARS